MQLFWEEVMSKLNHRATRQDVEDLLLNVFYSMFESLIRVTLDLVIALVDTELPFRPHC